MFYVHVVLEIVMLEFCSCGKNNWNGIILLALYPTLLKFRCARYFESVGGGGAPKRLRSSLWRAPGRFVVIPTNLGLLEVEPLGRARLLFSAHGLPKKLVARADPHQRHVELSAVAIVEELGMDGLYGRLYSQSCVARFGMNSILY